MKAWEIAGIAVVVVLGIWGGWVRARHWERHANWSTEFGNRHGIGAQQLLGALVGAGCLLIAVMLPGDDAEKLLIASLGMLILAIFGWRYLARRGQT